MAKACRYSRGAQIASLPPCFVLFLFFFVFVPF